MPVSPRPVLVGWIVLALSALVVLVPAAHASPAVAAPTSPTSAAHPYSDPTWFPLRTPTRVGCARSGCHSSADHGYDAIDLLGHEGDPVYAAGAGIAHVGGNSGSCSGSGEVVGGRWVWIDHGGGVVSRYHHLSAIAVSEGQLVTPATRIGAMGHSGDVPPCATAYLHFEVRHGGTFGERVDFGSLRGCGVGGPLQLPQALGFDSWDDPGLHPAKALVTPALDSSCVTPDWTTTADRPTPRITRTNKAVRVALDVPAGAGSWAVNLEIWRPTLNGWRTLTMAQLPAGTTSTVFTAGVENQRRYRVQAAIHQGSGWSAWSVTREAVAAPDAPGLRYLTWKRTTSNKKSYLHYGWSRPATLGSPVTGYAVASRCAAKAAGLGGWKTSKLKGNAAYKNIRGLGAAKVCEVRIQAKNAVGTGPWSDPRRVTR